MAMRLDMHVPMLCTPLNVCRMVSAVKPCTQLLSLLNTLQLLRRECQKAVHQKMAARAAELEVLLKTQETCPGFLKVCAPSDQDPRHFDDR